MEEGSLRLVRAQAAAAQTQEAAVRKQLAGARRWRTFWQELLAKLDAEQPASALLLLRREETALRCQGDALIPSASLDALIASLDQQARAAAAQFQQTFPAAILAAGLTPDANSRYPRFTLCQGFLHVGVDDDQLTATVRPRDGVEILLGLDIALLLDTIRHEIGRLFDRPLDAGVFLSRLRLAYAAHLTEDERCVGEALPLRRLLARLNQDGKPYPADEFNIDLAQLVRSGHTSIDGQRLQLHHTRRTKQGMLLAGLEQGGYVGFISFGQEGTG
jgi:hypothetical protein